MHEERPTRFKQLWWTYSSAARTLLFRNQSRRWRYVGRDPRPAWDERNRIIASLIAPRSSVLDLGCGAQTLRSYLPAGCAYQPCDLVATSPGVIPCDFNAGQYPLLEGSYDFVVCSGVLEYIRDAERFLRRISLFGDCLIVSYNPRLAGESRLSRLAHNWVNHFTRPELEALFAGCGLKAELAGTRKQRELIYVLHA